MEKKRRIRVFFPHKKSDLYAEIPVLHLAKFSKDSFSQNNFPYEIRTNNERKKNADINWIVGRFFHKNQNPVLMPKTGSRIILPVPARACFHTHRTWADVAVMWPINQQKSRLNSKTPFTNADDLSGGGGGCKMSVYPKSGHDLGRDMIIFEPYVDQDAQNQSKVARVTFPFDSVPAWMAGAAK